MASFGVALPLELDFNDGYTMLKSIRNLIKQNFKMLLLTNPGERIMEPDFGVGLKRYLFENYGSGVEADINNKIRQQVRIYLPIVKIQSIKFGTSNPDDSLLGILISYSIPDIGARDLLELTI
tara:strand:+ start:2932 stop:3300 length:369 start_codon:yes stop_codon:yes gene_type:complete